jgi:hypothetical protein
MLNDALRADSQTHTRLLLFIFTLFNHLLDIQLPFLDSSPCLFCDIVLIGNNDSELLTDRSPHIIFNFFIFLLFEIFVQLLGFLLPFLTDLGRVLQLVKSRLAFYYAVSVE